MPSSTSPPVSHEPRRLASLWAGLLTGPVAWLSLLQFNYTASYVACETRSTWFMHGAVASAFVLVAVAGMVAWRARYTGLADEDTATYPMSDRTRIQRSNWMSLAGVAISGWFLVVILAMEIPLLVLKECQ
jgi:hypothetical protein